MSRSAVKEVSAGGVVIRPGNKGYEVLMIKDHRGKWTFPKGHIEGDEEPAQTAVREIGEETGLERLQVRGAIGKTRYFFRDKWQNTGRLVDKTVLYYLLEAPHDAQPNPPKNWSHGTEPIADAKWFSLQHAAKKTGYKDNAKLLAKTQKILAKGV